MEMLSEEAQPEAKPDAKHRRPAGFVKGTAYYPFFFFERFKKVLINDYISYIILLWLLVLDLKMRFDSKRHHRRSIRLKGYDYSSTGIYFITICTENRDCLLGDIENGRMKLSDIGEIVNTEWLQSFEIRKEIKLDTYVIMPNHIHAIVYLDSTVGANGGLPPTNNYQISKNGLPPTNKFQIPKYENNKNSINKRANCHSPLQMKPRSLSSFVAGFKSTVSRKIGFSVWQRSYYDHIIRNDEDLDNIRKYIKDNPINWSEDEDNPINKK